MTWNVAKMILKEHNGNTIQSIAFWLWMHDIIAILFKMVVACMTLFVRSARGDEVFNGESNPLGTGGDGALESDSNFLGSGEEAVFNSP